MAEEQLEERTAPVVMVAGLSGAGKSTALRVFEDMGYFVVDGLPASMAPKLVALYQGQEQTRRRGLAVGLDVRQPDLVRAWDEALDDLGRVGVEPQIVFLEATPEELQRRYAETRRPHPLEAEGYSLAQAISRERELLSPLKTAADLVLDTSHYSIHDLRRALQEKWSYLAAAVSGLRVHVLSFGFKYGPPTEADLVFDLRFLPNPYFEPELKPLTGQDARIQKYVLDNPVGREFLERFLDFLRWLVPLYDAEGRFRLTIACGCTGGRHRSVTVAERVFAVLKDQGYAVTLEHRHIDRA